MPSVARYLVSLPATIDRRDSSTVGGSSAFFSLGSLPVGWALLGVGADSDSVTLTSGTAGTATVLSTALGGGSTTETGSGGFCTGTGLGGAGITLVIPSGPSLVLFWFWRRRSAAPPGRGLKALAALAAFQKAPAISPFDFFDLIIGPSPGRISSSGSGAGFGGVLSAVGVGTGGMGPAGGAVGGGDVTTGLGAPPKTAARLVSFGVVVCSARGGGSFLRLIESLRGAIRSTLRGGTMGSRRMPGLMSGAGIKSLSACNDLRGSMGGRFLSGGFSSACRGLLVSSGVAYGELPLTPFLDLGRRLFASSLRVIDEAATESWLLLLWATRRSDGCS